METRASHFLVGLFTLVVLVGLTVAVVWLGHGEYARHGKQYRIFFDNSVAGLQQGAPVRLSGVPVGSVTRIGLDIARPGRVQVDIEVMPDTPVKTDTIAATEMAGVTGNATIELKGGTAAASDLATSPGNDDSRWGIIPAQPGGSASLLVALPHLIEKFNGVADRLDRIASDRNIAAIDNMLERMDHLSGVLDGEAPKLERTVDNADALVASLRGQVPKLAGKAISTLNDVDATTHKLNDVIDENRKPLRDFTSDGLANVDALVGDLRDLTQSLDRISQRVEHDPRAVLFGTEGGVEAK